MIDFGLFQSWSDLDVSSLGDILLQADKLSAAAKFKISKPDGFDCSFGDNKSVQTMNCKVYYFNCSECKIGFGLEKDYMKHLEDKHGEKREKNEIQEKNQVRPAPKKNYSLTITRVKQETSTGISGPDALITTGSNKLVKSKERHYPIEANVIVKNKPNYGRNLIDISDYELAPCTDLDEIYPTKCRKCKQALCWGNCS